MGNYPDLFFGSSRRQFDETVVEHVDAALIQREDSCPAVMWHDERIETMEGKGSTEVVAVRMPNVRAWMSVKLSEELQFASAQPDNDVGVCFAAHMKRAEGIFLPRPDDRRDNGHIRLRVTYPVDDGFALAPPAK